MTEPVRTDGCGEGISVARRAGHGRRERSVGRSVRECFRVGGRSRREPRHYSPALRMPATIDVASSDDLPFVVSP